ncbi:MAG: YbaK/EbsC family protein [Alphaproteobacteria bacterium]
MGVLNRDSVQRVRDALVQHGSNAKIVALEETARTARDAAAALGCSLGAIVKSLVFLCGDEAVLALVAGDRQCDPAELRGALGRTGDVKIADADAVRTATGFAIGGVAPVGHPKPLPTLIDDSLRRFDTVYAAAGHPHCVFGTTVDELFALTGGRVAAGITRL